MNIVLNYLKYSINILSRFWNQHEILILFTKLIIEVNYDAEILSKSKVLCKFPLFVGKKIEISSLLSVWLNEEILTIFSFDFRVSTIKTHLVIKDSQMLRVLYTIAKTAFKINF